MPLNDLLPLSFDEFDEHHYPRDEETDFERLAARAISRRGFLRGTAAFGATAFVLGAGALAPGAAHANGAWLRFSPVAA